MAAARIVINERYELERLPVARGGMGEVWTGRDVKLDRAVAVKFIRFPDGQPDDELTRRFVRESRISARLEHPGVPAVYDVGTHQGRPYLVMQRVRGVSLADLVAEHGPLPVPWVASIAAQTCSVLSVAHQASLIHRDLKPGNLMLCPDGTVKVLDFGLAVALDRTDLSKITRTGDSPGTPAYMAPEQVLAGTSAPHTDLYALGCTMHEMLTGQQLFSGSTAYAVMNQQVDSTPVPVRAVRSRVPKEIEALVLQLVEKKPEDRPRSAREVYDALLPFAAGRSHLPGVLDPPETPNAVRAYAAVAGQRISAEPAVEVADTGEPAPEPALHRDDLRHARDAARSMARQSRYSQAAEALERVAAPAGLALGTLDQDVVSVRLDLANVLFEGGDYRRATPLYRQLADDLVDRDGEADELVLRCRLREATCLALTGDTDPALSRLTGVLLVERRAYGDDDPRTLELRRQIGLLELGAGRIDAARTTLDDLLTDIARINGDQHPDTRRLRELLGTLTAVRDER